LFFSFSKFKMRARALQKRKEIDADIPIYFRLQLRTGPTTPVGRWMNG
jgi:hypothetical protein